MTFINLTMAIKHTTNSHKKRVHGHKIQPLMCPSQSPELNPRNSLRTKLKITERTEDPEGIRETLYWSELSDSLQSLRTLQETTRRAREYMLFCFLQ